MSNSRSKPRLSPSADVADGAIIRRVEAHQEIPSAYHAAAASALAVVLFLAPACGGPAFRAAHSALLGEPVAAESQPVSPGQLFGGEWIQVRAPTSPGWVLLRESSAQIQFGRAGASSRETYAAIVSFFELPVTGGREDFTALIRRGRESDTSPERFADARASYEYTEERGYPCVKYVATSLDLKAPGGALPLAEHGLYCRHPRREGMGFWALYSERALKLDSDLAEQARMFLEGVVVPDTQAPH